MRDPVRKQTCNGMKGWGSWAGRKKAHYSYQLEAENVLTNWQGLPEQILYFNGEVNNE